MSTQGATATGIGAAERRKEDLRFITGRGQYTDGVCRPGEAGVIAAPAAVINAIADAVDTEEVAMPATPQVVWAAAKKAVEFKTAA